MLALFARGCRASQASPFAARAFSSTRGGRASVDSTEPLPGRGAVDSEAGDDPAEQWLATTSLPEIRSGSVIKALPWEPNPVYLPLSSLIARQPGEPRAASNVIALEPSVFDHPIRRDILHLCVIYHRDGLRQGTASTKTRGEVSGSGKKLRPQKGTGRARLGDRGSPMLRGGGRAFGPKPRDFATLLPRKMQEMGLRVALSAKLKERALGVVKTLEWPEVKTREFKRRVGSLGWKKVLFVCGASEVPRNLLLSSRNLQEVECTTAREATVYDLLKWPTVVLDVAAVDWFHKQLGKAPLAVEDVTGPLSSLKTDSSQDSDDGVLHTVSEEGDAQGTQSTV